MTQPTQDLHLSYPVPSGGGIVPFVTSQPVDPPGAASNGGYPVDDDTRFPYQPRALHATGYQFDVTALRPLADDYASGVLDELGCPIRDEYGAPIA